MLIPIEQQKVIDVLKEKLLDISASREGVRLCFTIINFASVKDRKIIVKCFKDKIYDVLMTKMNNQSNESLQYLVILKLLHSVDDTKLLEKVIYLIIIKINYKYFKMVMKELKANFDEIINCKNGLNVICSLFIPNHNILKDIEGEVTNS